MLNSSFRCDIDQVHPNAPAIIHHKSISDNSLILNAVEISLSSSGFDIDLLNAALDVVKIEIV